jgi:hypothetical protein
MARLIRRLERVQPPELSAMKFIAICLLSLAGGIASIVFGS